MELKKQLLSAYNNPLLKAILGKVNEAKKLKPLKKKWHSVPGETISVILVSHSQYFLSSNSNKKSHDKYLLWSGKLCKSSAE